MISKSDFIDVYTNTISTATTPIMGMILFIIGYNLKVNLDTIGSLLKLLVVRIAFYIAVIIGFFILFPHLMTEKTYVIAVIIYFMCPTGFALPMQISPLYKNEEDASYTSAFISLNMIITLIVYACVVLFIVYISMIHLLYKKKRQSKHLYLYTALFYSNPTLLNSSSTAFK